MATAVVVFDDKQHLAQDFGRTLDEELQSLGIVGQIYEAYVSYREDAPRQGRSTLNTRDPTEVAELAAQWATAKKKLLKGAGDSQVLDRFVFVVDLSPEDTSTPQSDYGLRVIKELPRRHSPYQASEKEFLCSGKCLVTILSTFLKPKVEMAGFVHDFLSDVTLIYRHPDNDAIGDAVASVKRCSPRIVVADRIGDRRWLAKVVAQWVKEP